MPSASIDGEIRFLSVHQFALAACQYWFHIVLYYRSSKTP
jgi:hypothetical protein